SPHSPPTPLSTLSLHDALPIFMAVHVKAEEPLLANERLDARRIGKHHLDLDPEVLPHPIDETVRLRVEAARIEREHAERTPALRSEEHTSELQSRENLVCRLLL